VVNPWDVVNRHGADAIRWYMYTASPPGNERRFSDDLVGETVRHFLSTLWNTYSFFVTYANLADFQPWEPGDEPLSEMDRWVRSELHRTVRAATEALEEYELNDAARPIEQFVEELSNWYVRRSRRRFWRSGDDADSRAALRTLYECLVTVAKLLAPFTPFVAEALYRNLVAGRVPGAPDSVHLAEWPAVDEEAIDDRLSAEMDVAQRMVSLGRAARSSAQVRVRQPLGTTVLVPRTAEEQTALERLAPIVAEELNVKSVAVSDDPGDRLSYTLRPNLPVLGPRYGSEVGKIRGALESADAASVVRSLRAGQPVQLGGFELGGGDVLVTVEASEGWAAAEDGGYVALLDTTITPELRAEGLSREIVRRLQDLRREAGLDVSDRIDVRYTLGDGAEELGHAFEAHGAYIAEETLALSIEAGAELDGGASVEANVDGAAITLSLRKAAP